MLYFGLYMVIALLTTFIISPHVDHFEYRGKDRSSIIVSLLSFVWPAVVLFILTFMVIDIFDKITGSEE